MADLSTNQYVVSQNWARRYNSIEIMRLKQPKFQWYLLRKVDFLTTCLPDHLYSRTPDLLTSCPPDLLSSSPPGLLTSGHSWSNVQSYVFIHTMRQISNVVTVAKWTPDLLTSCPPDLLTSWPPDLLTSGRSWSNVQSYFHSYHAANFKCYNKFPLLVLISSSFSSSCQYSVSEEKVPKLVCTSKSGCLKVLLFRNLAV